MTLTDILKLAQSGGILALMIASLLAGHKGLWLWKREYDAMVALKDAEIDRLTRERDSDMTRSRADAEAESRRLNEERARERERAAKYEEYTFRLLEAASTAARVATSAVEKRSGG